MSIGSNDCGKGCTWCDGDCQNFGTPIPKDDKTYRRGDISHPRRRPQVGKEQVPIRALGFNCVTESKQFKKNK